jgi:energy-coupling factor transport system permease protein
MTTAPAHATPSFLYRLNPLTKLFVVLCLSTLAMLFLNLILLVGIISVCLALSFAAGISARQLWGYTRIFIYLIIFLVIVQGIFYPYAIVYPLIKAPSDSPILANYTLLSLDGLLYGLTLGIRLISLVIASTIFGLTTTPRDFLTSLRKIKVPFEIAFMVNIALRFIPDIKDKASEILLAQTARGLELEKGSLFKKLKNLTPLLVPLLINYLLMARNSAVTLETRAFRWKNERTYMRYMRFTKTDQAIICITLALTVTCGVVFWLYGVSLKI